MSLLNQLIAAVFAVLIGLVSGTYYITSDNAQTMLLNQLRSHGQDTATHLGLYLAPYMADQDLATIETTVNAIFDSGFYQTITVTNEQGAALFTTTTPPRIDQQVPEWFIHLNPIEPPLMQREVSYQWRKVGTVQVQSRAGYAYQQLWHSAQQTTLWFALLSLVAVFLLSYLIRLIMRPLQGLEQQANALAERQYIETQLPKTRELRSVASAMNKMVKRVQRMFEEQTQHIDELRRSAYQDGVTGLANLKATQAQLSDWLDHRKEFGANACIYLHIPRLQEKNQQLGVDQANNFLRQVSDELVTLASHYDPHILGRLSGADFMLLVPATNEQTIKRQVSELMERLTRLLTFYQLTDQHPVQLHLAVSLSDEHSQASEVLSQARLAIRQAIEQNQDIYYPHTFSGSRSASQAWQEHVAERINQQAVFLQYQPVIAADGATVIQRELLARILNQQGNPCTALEFISVVKELGLIEALDKAVFQQALDYLVQHPDATALTLNLSQSTVHNPSFYPWLNEVLGKRSLQGQLNIEINETAVLSDIDYIARFRAHLRPLGIGFGIDNFGTHPSGFGYLYAIQPDYIKIDGSLSKAVDQNAEDRFFVSSLITAAHSLGIAVYAERVEHEAQVASLRQMKIDATQGFLHGLPKALEPESTPI